MYKTSSYSLEKSIPVSEGLLLLTKSFPTSFQNPVLIVQQLPLIFSCSTEQYLKQMIDLEKLTKPDDSICLNLNLGQGKVLTV